LELVCAGSKGAHWTGGCEIISIRVGRGLLRAIVMAGTLAKSSSTAAGIDEPGRVTAIAQHHLAPLTRLKALVESNQLEPCC